MTPAYIQWGHRSKSCWMTDPHLTGLVALRVKRGSTTRDIIRASDIYLSLRLWVRADQRLRDISGCLGIATRGSGFKEVFHSSSRMRELACRATVTRRSRDSRLPLQTHLGPFNLVSTPFLDVGLLWVPACYSHLLLCPLLRPRQEVFAETLFKRTI